jgi:PilZ domain
MGIEQRKHQRRNVRHPAIILKNDGSLFRQCLVKDVSAAGAMLEMQTPDKAPDEFILRLSRYGSVHRKCKVLWRSANALGVQFITAK